MLCHFFCVNCLKILKDADKCSTLKIILLCKIVMRECYENERLWLEKE